MPTARQAAKTISVGTIAVAVDPAVELGTNAVTLHEYLTVKNRGSAEIGVHALGGTASINGDDVEHIAPGGFEIFEVTTLSMVCAAALANNVEVSGTRGRPPR